MRVASDGYDARRSVIMPALPLLTAGLSRATGLPVPVAGLILCNLAGALCLVLLALYARHFLPLARARQSVWMLALLPSSFYLNCFYTEPLFMAGGLACALAALRGRLTQAGGFAALVALTRNLGLGILALILDAIRRARRGAVSKDFALLDRSLASPGLALGRAGPFYEV